MIAQCPVCRSDDRRDVLSLLAMPVLINAQVRPEAALDVPRGDIDLVVCCGCGHLYNRSFEASLLDYDASYENTLHFSPSFRAFAAELADRLIDDHDLGGQAVAELGSGPGHFLSMLCERGAGRGHGFDPSYDPQRLGAPEHAAVTVSTEPFPTDGYLSVSLAYSQHVLEHLDDPVSALLALRGAIAPLDGVVYSEVPNGQLMIEKCALWDLIYEHPSYFVPSSLELAHRRAGLGVTRTDAAFSDQFLWCEAVASESSDAMEPGTVADSVARAVRFGEEATARIGNARTELEIAAADGPVVLWGAGSKGMTYLNVVDVAGLVAGVVDINPRKEGWGVPGTRHVIGGAEQVASIQPATVLLANPAYRDEVVADLRRLGTDVQDVVALWS